MPLKDAPQFRTMVPCTHGERADELIAAVQSVQDRLSQVMPISPTKHSPWTVIYLKHDEATRLHAAINAIATQMAKRAKREGPPIGPKKEHRND